MAVCVARQDFPSKFDQLTAPHFELIVHEYNDRRETRARRANSAYFRIAGPLAGSRCVEAIEPRSFLSAAPHPIGGIVRRQRRIALPPGPPDDLFLAIQAEGSRRQGRPSLKSRNSGLEMIAAVQSSQT